VGLAASWQLLDFVEMHGMELLGYSERGLLNAFFYECHFAADPAPLLRGFLQLAHWPGGQPPQDLSSADCKLVLLEQSFSDFGDADVVLAFETGSGPLCIFCEGKRGNEGRLPAQWKSFTHAYQNGIRKGLSSNLISQLYFKQRFAAALSAGEDIATGLEFDGPLSIKTRLRKIGAKPVVLKAVDRLRPFLGAAYFLMLIPCSDAVEASQGFAEMQKFSPAPSGWDLKNWGYLTVQDLERFCSTRGLDTYCLIRESYFRKVVASLRILPGQRPTGTPELPLGNGGDPLLRDEARGITVVGRPSNV
jgi:hypothetical protein